MDTALSGRFPLPIASISMPCCLQSTFSPWRRLARDGHHPCPRGARVGDQGKVFTVATVVDPQGAPLCHWFKNNGARTSGTAAGIDPDAPLVGIPAAAF